MKNHTDLDDMLLDYLDGNLSSSEKQYIDQLLTSDSKAKSRMDELRAIETYFTKSFVEEPSPNFTGRVMNKLLHSPGALAASIRNGVLLLAGVLLAAGICAIMAASGIFDGTSTINPNDVEFLRHTVKQSLPVISLSTKAIVNGIILINLVLAFLVLDRAILKPWFTMRAQMRL